VRNSARRLDKFNGVNTYGAFSTRNASSRRMDEIVAKVVPDGPPNR